MLKSLLAIKTIIKLVESADKDEDLHVESFNRLQCHNIDQAPTTDFSLCGTAYKRLGVPEKLFPLKRKQDKLRSTAKSEKINGWLALVKTMSQFGARGQIAGINNYINGLETVSPIAAYGKTKNWSTPVRYFRCEDHSENHAIAKYLSLRLLGFHPERLHLVWLKIPGENSPHAVLMVKISDQTFVLDSRKNAITTDDMLAKERPICSLNGNHFSVHWDEGIPGGAKKAMARLTKHARQSATEINLSAAA